MNENKDSRRLVRVDIMIGLAMLFVVVGHLSVGLEPEWYSEGLHQWIYSFHMELFLFLSAFLIRYTYKGVDSIKDYFRYIWRKFKKFFVWFLVIGMSVALLACVFKGVELTGKHVWHSLKLLLLYPRWSEASFLWYIYILFGYYLISPLFFRLPQWVRVVCCIGAMFLAMLEGNTFLASHEFCQYTFFYCLGVLCAEWIEDIRGVKRWQWGLLSLPFAIYTVWFFSEGMSYGVGVSVLGWWTLVIGTASIPFFFLTATAIENVKPLTAVLSSISRNCYWIYLLQMFVIWGCVQLIKVAGVEESMPFWLFAILATILAIALPIALGAVFRKLQNGKKK